MSKSASVIVALGAVSLSMAYGCSTNEQRCDQNWGVCESLTYRESLEAIDRADQLHRDAISWGTADPDELARLNALDDEANMAEWGRRNAEGIKLDPELEKELWVKQIKIDRANTQELMRLIEQYGWPTDETAGEGFPSPVPVLIHMQPEDAAWVLPKLRIEVLAGRMDAEPYAMIYDRKQQHDGVPQLYGKTQFFDSKTRTILAPAIVDIDATNRARAEIGLGPLEEYRITDPQAAAGK